MIAVMQHFDDKGRIESRVRNSGNEWCEGILPHWDWSRFEYRIKPKKCYVLAKPIGDCKIGTPVIYTTFDSDNYWITHSTKFTNRILSSYVTETEESALKRLIADGWVKEA